MSGPVRWEHRVHSGSLRELTQVRADPATVPGGLRPYVFTH